MSVAGGSERTLHHELHEGEHTVPGTNRAEVDLTGLPRLHLPHRRRKTILAAGIILAILDLCCLPITYYYALKFDTNLDLQDIFAVITGVYGLLSFTHFSFRSLKLFRAKTASKYRPVGWTKWGMLEFLQINILICITLFEIELVAGTAPNKPIVRLCAMPSPTICFYFGFLFCISAALTQMRKRLPFNMSSTDKGSLWKPALVAFIEDAGAVEGRGEVGYRTNVMKRYEVSPMFRRMMLILTWIWGIGFLLSASVSTILIMVLSEDIGFGVGWGLPWFCSFLLAIFTIFFIRVSLKKERADWSNKESRKTHNSFGTARTAV